MSEAAIYVRLSRVRAGEEPISLDTQEADARQLGKRLGYDVVGIYREAGRSAFAVNRSRPEWDRLVADLPRFDAVLAWSADRLARDEEEWHRFVRLATRAGTRIVTVSDGVDTSSGDLLSPSIRAAVAAEESRRISKRVARALRERRERGDSHGGPRRYGYERGPDGLVVVPDEAEVIRSIAARVLDGEGLASIVNDLNARGVPATNGGSWRRTSLRGVLAGPTVVGLRSFDQEPTPRWEPILDRATSDAVRARLSAHPRSIIASPGRRLLRGFAVCGKCGTALVGATRTSRGMPDYVCRRPADGGCGGIRIGAEGLEEWIRDAVIWRAATPDIRAGLEALGDGRANVESLSRQLVKLERVADEIATEYGMGRISRRTMLRATDGNETERAAVERKIADAVAVTSPILADAPRTEVALRRWWDSAPEARRRTLIAALLERITVGPGKRGPNHRFQVERISIDWRAGQEERAAIEQLAAS